MKELSIEEKAKRYDIALDKIKRLLGTGSSCSREELEYVFPELAESKDERIRKELISFFKDRKSRLDRMEDILDPSIFPCGDYSLCEKAISWLENQGEQKSANWLQELEDKLANATPQQLAEWKEKYFKEEPAEWSEEDREYMQSLLDIINGTSSLTPSEVECHKDWLKSLKDRVQPQFTWKPSDRQMNVLEYYMHTLACNEHKEILFGLYQDLKKLKE